MTVRSLWIPAAALIALAALGERAEARNPHCAGGIQYVFQGNKDKEKNNIEDYRREMNKAVQQLEQCAAEDPTDLEALGYLAWAYAEVDSCAKAGKTFQAAIDGLKAKGDLKKAEPVVNNRNSYWVTAFNDGISKINQAQQAYPEYGKKPENDADQTLRGEATKRYGEAMASLTRALLLRPGDSQTIRNLGAVHAFMLEYDTAAEVLQAGLREAPGDTALTEALRAARVNYAGQLIDQKKYREAAGFYSDLVKGDPKNSDLYLGMADAHFRLGKEQLDAAERHAFLADSLRRISRFAAAGQESAAAAQRRAAAKPEFMAAGDAYSTAGQLKPTDGDLPFNGAYSYQNAGEWALAEAQWKATLKIRPNDIEAISALGASLAELHQFSEALEVLHQGVLSNPKNKALHRQLGAVYTKMQNNPKSTEELMVFLALQHGQAVADVAARAKAAPAGSAAAKQLASGGVPDEIVPWEVDQQKIETWFYWSKNLAYHFQDGSAYGKSDWSTTGAATVTPPPGKKK